MPHQTPAPRRPGLLDGGLPNRRYSTPNRQERTGTSYPDEATAWHRNKVANGAHPRAKNPAQPIVHIPYPRGRPYRNGAAMFAQETSHESEKSSRTGLDASQRTYPIVPSASWSRTRTIRSAKQPAAD